MDDQRFKKVFTDPRFRSIKKKPTKIEVDDRFKEMFTDEKFKSEYRIDKRGKPIYETTEQNLKKFYRLKNDKKKKKKKPASKLNEQVQSQKSDEITEDGLSKETPVTETVDAEENEVEVQSESEDNATEHDDESSEEEESSSEEDDGSDVDLARGYGNIESSDFSDDDEMYNDETPAQVFDHKWNELDEEAPREEKISKRLALCNMDWDRIKAEDVFMLFHSFKPKQAAGIKKVSIYMSEFGKERMKEEELKGPKEIRESNPTDLEDVDEKEGEKYHVENLRQYQINRLKYYYAVIEFDCMDTANEIYTTCDGMEFETSASKLDLRFIPDDMEFDDEPTQVCLEMPDKDLYQPTRFVTTALNQSKVDLTWDETDKRRVTIMTRRFKEEELDEMDFKEYLASSSGEAESDEEVEVEQAPRVSRTSSLDQIQRYRSLLFGEMDEEENKSNKDDDVHMEITWNAFDSEDKKSPAADEEGGNKEEEFFADSEDSDESGDDDDVSEGKKKVRFARDDEEEESEESKKQKAQLTMLMMDDNGEEAKKHFNMNKIIKSYEEKNKKKKRKNKKKQTEQEEDNFEIDLKDERFSSVFTSSEYAIDPNAPQFKKTAAMMKVVEERRKRRVEGGTAATERKTTNNNTADDGGDSKAVSSAKSQQNTSSLVKLIKTSTKGVKKQQSKSKTTLGAGNAVISGILKKPTIPEDNDEATTVTKAKEQNKVDVESSAESTKSVGNKGKEGKKKKKASNGNKEENSSAPSINTSKQEDQVSNLVASIRAKQAKKRASSNQATTTGVTKKSKK